MMLPPAEPKCFAASCDGRGSAENIEIELLVEVLFSNGFQWRKV